MENEIQHAILNDGLCAHLTAQNIAWVLILELWLVEMMVWLNLSRSKHIFLRSVQTFGFAVGNPVIL